MRLPVHQGQAFLERYLAGNDINVRGMSLPEFRTWLAQRIEAEQNRESYRRLWEIREIRRDHRRPLREREARLATAEELCAASKTCELIAGMDKRLSGLRAAVDGLRRAVADGRADHEKLRTFEVDLAAAEQEQADLIADCPEYRRRDRARKSLAEYEAAIGLTQAETELEHLRKSGGRQASRSGSSFEQTAEAIAEQHLVPLFFSRDETAIRLHGVTLGCAKAELDQLLVTPPDDRGIVSVRAIIEVKRNVNDIVHGFRMRQENLAWFVRDESRYDPAEYRTDTYRDGHFEGVAVHRENEKDYRFDASSFAAFRKRDSQVGLRFQGVCFIAENRELLGVTAEELSRVLHRAATDLHFSLDSDRTLRSFHREVMKFIEPFQTRDVFERYAADDRWANQVVLCDR